MFNVWRVPISMMLFGSCSGHPPAARSPAALPPFPSGIWAVGRAAHSNSKPFDWSRRRHLNEADDLGIDTPTFMLGDWRLTGGSSCRHSCNDPVSGLGTTGQCDEDTSVCSTGTDCEDCGEYSSDELFATMAESYSCHADVSITCSGSVGTYTAGCAELGFEDRTVTGNENNPMYIDPGQASSSCSAGGSSASFTSKYAVRDDDTPVNMKDIRCTYHDRSSRNMQETVAYFRRTLSTPLSSITCPSDASSARALAIQRPVGTEYYDMSVSISDVTCTGDCGALVCSSTCAPPSPPASGTAQIELCTYTTSDCSDTPQKSECSTFTDENIKETCISGNSVLGGDSATGAANVACEDDTLKLELYSNSQCNSDVGSECHILQAFAEGGMTDCHIAFELNKCINLMGMGIYVKATGKCASEVPIGAIVGGVVGGVVGLALIIGVTVGLFCFCKKKNAGSSGAPTGMQLSGAAVATPVATAVAMPAAAGKV